MKRALLLSLLVLVGCGRSTGGAASPVSPPMVTVHGSIAFQQGCRITPQRWTVLFENQGGAIVGREELPPSTKWTALPGDSYQGQDITCPWVATYTVRLPKETFYKLQVQYQDPETLDTQSTDWTIQSFSDLEKHGYEWSISGPGIPDDLMSISHPAP